MKQRLRDHLRITKPEAPLEDNGDTDKEMLSKFQKLNSLVESLQEENDDLRLKLVAKQLDIDNL